VRDWRCGLSNRPGRRDRLAWKADQTGWHFLQARLTAPSVSPVAYRLSIVPTRRGSAAGEQLVAGNVPDHAGGAADDDLAGGHVLRHHGPCADERLLAHLDARAEDRSAADARASTPAQSIAPPPTPPPRRIVAPFISSSRLSVRPMKLSFVVTTHGATKTSSSSVEYAVTYASAWIFVRAPIVVSFSTSEPRPTTTSSPIVTRSRTQDWS